MTTRRAPLAVLVASLTACAGAAQAEGCARHEARFPALVGGSPEAARAALSALPGIRAVRVGGPDTPMTQDYRPDRATVLVVDGVVRRIRCG